MASTKEKELIGLPKDATDEQFQARVSALLELEKAVKKYTGSAEDTGITELIAALEPEPKPQNIADEKLQATAESYFKDNAFAKKCWINKTTGDLFATEHQLVSFGVLAENTVLAEKTKDNKISIRPLKN